VGTALRGASAILGVLKKKNLLPPQGFEPPIIQSIGQSLYHIDIKSKLINKPRNVTMLHIIIIVILIANEILSKI
jgi:hypothetical protein